MLIVKINKKELRFFIERLHFIFIAIENGHCIKIIPCKEYCNVYFKKLHISLSCILRKTSTPNDLFFYQSNDQTVKKIFTDL